MLQHTFYPESTVRQVITIFLTELFKHIAELIRLLFSRRVPQDTVDPELRFANLSAAWRETMGAPESTFRSNLYKGVYVAVSKCIMNMQPPNLRREPAPGHSQCPEG
jgi:hypothetical protein